MVSGQTPFQAENTQLVYESIQKCEPSYNRHVTPLMKDLLSKIFVPDPEMRISIEKIKKHSLFRVSVKSISFLMNYFVDIGSRLERVNARPI